MSAQSSVIPIGSDQEYYIDRLCIQYGSPPYFQRNIKPFFRKDIIDLLQYWDSLGVLQEKEASFIKYMCDENNEWTWKLHQVTDTLSKSFVDSNFYYLRQIEAKPGYITYTQSEKPILKYFYQSPAHFFEVNKKDFYLRLNPMLNLQGGRDLTNSESILANQRGVDLRVGIDDKIYVQTNIVENQLSYPAFFRNKISKFNAIPGVGFFKVLTKSSTYKPIGYDYFLSNAQLGIKISNHVQLQIGHGTNFIGDGIRSEFLSDYANDYFFLKLNTRIWKFHYQNIFAELAANSYSSASPQGNQLTPKKYMATHTLQLQALPRWNIGLFETVLFHRKDHFEFQYLNPVIIYRSVEGSIGSPDNVMLGINSRYDVNKSVSMYGQLLIDEFQASEVFKGNGYWGNKFGFQAGVKYLNVLGIDRLDAQLELNTARPFTYSHFDSIANYSNQSTPLAHPLGANYKEILLKLRYQPTVKWTANAYAMLYKWGDDPSTNENYGSNIFKSYTTRVSDFGNKTTQGILRNIVYIGATFSYQLFHNYFFDVNAYYRKDKNFPADNTKYIGAGFRVNMWRKDMNLL
ncbi:MAG: hypothetical protein ABI844_14875 [Saprospiraceae bacterium]